MSTVTNVYRGVRGLQSAIKDVGRLRQIMAILAKHGFGAAISKLQLGELIGLKGDSSGDTLSSASDTMAKRIRIAIEELGPTFVKLGQILSTRTDLLSPDFIEEFQKLQDAVPEMPWEDIRHQVEGALGHPINELFQSFDQAALASASVAQVHRAVLSDGTEVAVKIQRKGIQASIQSDLNILHFLAQRSEQLIPELGLIDPVGITTEFERALSKELNFGNERSNIERFKENFTDFEGIHVPEVYRDYCTDTVLTMEFIRGVKVTEAPKKLKVDPYKLAPVMLRAMLKMVLKDGFFHGDLHPGNILIRDDHSITLVDFGLVGRLLPRQRADILDLLAGIATEDYETIARVTFDLGKKVPESATTLAPSSMT